MHTQVCVVPYLRAAVCDQVLVPFIRGIGTSAIYPWHQCLSVMVGILVTVTALAIRVLPQPPLRACYPSPLLLRQLPLLGYRVHNKTHRGRCRRL